MKSDRSNSILVWLLAAAVLLVLGLTVAGYVWDRDFETKLAEVGLQLTESMNENAELRAELQKIRTEFRDISRTAEAMGSLLASSSEEFTSALRSGLRRNEQLINEKEATLERIREEVENFQSEIAGMNEKNREAIDSLRDETGELKKLLSDNSEEIAALSSAHYNLRTLHANLKSDLEEAIAHTNTSKEIRKLLEEHHISIAEIQEDLRKKTDSVNREMTRIEGDLKEMRLQINRLSSLITTN